MDRLDAMRVFARVVETGSFSTVARQQGVAQSTVSKQIAGLERHLGTQLLRRSSRELSLTEAGRDFYEATVRLLAELDAAESRVRHDRTTPSGNMRVASSPAVARMYLVPRLPEFFAQYPDVAIEIVISERFVSLVEDGIDVALRIGHLTDSALIARRIGTIEVATVATPAYLARHGEPATPQDLTELPCVAFMFNGTQLSWDFKNAAGTLAIEPNARLRTNDAEHIRAGVLAGIGVGHNPTWLFAAEITSGAVRRVLRDYAPDPYPISAVYPGNRSLSAKVRAFTDFLAEVFAAEPHLALR
jgi:LysR family transcriptional regulator for bpeEF and oprC